MCEGVTGARDGFVERQTGCPPGPGRRSFRVKNSKVKWNQREKCPRKIDDVLHPLVIAPMRLPHILLYNYCIAALPATPTARFYFQSEVGSHVLPL